MHPILRLLFDPSGRLPRKRFWFGVLLVNIANLALGAALIAAGLGMSETVSGTVTLDNGATSSFSRTAWSLYPWVALIHAIIVAIPMSILAIKRRQDRDGSGWDVLVFTAGILILHLLGAIGVLRDFSKLVSLPFAIWGFVLFILVGCLRGTPATNGYGPDPLAAAAQPVPPPAPPSA
jgi:uncharacterized membrane protein YhaH (DUF805 family)